MSAGKDFTGGNGGNGGENSLRADWLTLPKWARGMMSERERERECQHRYEERLAILRDGAPGLPDWHEVWLAWAEAQELGMKLRIYLI